MAIEPTFITCFGKCCDSGALWLLNVTSSNGGVPQIKNQILKIKNKKNNLSNLSD
jgi:hypothetical protein